jgi:rSAM/selenodomain-associated transferase 2
MSVSIIIPTLNEEACIGATVRRLRARGAQEIIVADGGSTDRTLAEAGDADRVISASAGRALQMNQGAQHAQGDCLLFLHADCLPEDGALAEAERLLGSNGVVAGCFRMRVEAPGWLYRSIDGCATARVQLTGIAYGDQGLFLRRDRFERLGGFPSVPFMEDVFFSQILRREGKIAVARSRIFVSDRRWRKNGLVQQTLRNWTLTALALGGVPPQQLASYYPVVR